MTPERICLIAVGVALIGAVFAIAVIDRKRSWYESRFKEMTLKIEELQKGRQ